MYERFTDRARKVMQLANQEAQRFNHEYIGTEHILLGLVKEGSGVAANVLKNLDIDLRKIRLEVEAIIKSGPGSETATMGKLPQTPRAKKAVEYAIEEAKRLNTSEVGTGDLLLGLMREDEGVAAQVLMNLGLKLQDVRDELAQLLPGGPGPRAAVPHPPWEVQDLPAEEFPPEVGHALKELDAQIEALAREKDAAVAQQDFEKAAHLRDRGDQLTRRRRRVILQWQADHRPDPAWLSWGGGKAVTIARSIAQEGRWEDLPVLADALEEAACTDRDVLDHCRRPGDHVRGCWVIDLILGHR